MVSCQRMVACLIASGADVNCRDADGMTPLMYAAFKNGVHFVHMLINAGANPYAMDNEGFTALHHACMEKNIMVVNYLLKVAPDLLLLRGKPSLACLAPYLSILGTQIPLVPHKSMCFLEHYFTEDFLYSTSCPSSIKFDINVLRVVCQVLFNRSYLDIPRVLDILKRFIASRIEPVIEANGGVPVSSPRDVAKEKYQLALLKSIKSMDPTSQMQGTA